MPVSGRPFLVFALFVCAALLTAPVPAQTTGRLAGHVEDEHHAPLPGATVRLASPALMGERTVFSDGGGGFDFTSLPPGVYTVDVELEGFLPQRRTDVEVSVNRVAEVHIDLELGEFAGEITVVAEAPIVDVEQVSTSQTFTEEHLQESSVGSVNRRYYNLLAQAPGVVQTGSSRRTPAGAGAPLSANPRVFGSTQAENVYYIDGIDSTDPASSTVGVHLNFDTIQEIHMETGGFEARYGRATGGVINIVTKAGGNDLSGTFDLRYRDSNFNTNGEHFNKDEDLFEYSEPSFTLGGPVRRDRVWFFGATSRIVSKNTPTGSPTARELDRDNHLGKLTWQASDQWQVTGRYLTDRPSIDNANADRFTALEATSRVENETSIVSAEALGLTGTRFEWRLAASTASGEYFLSPRSGDLETLGHLDISLGYAASVNYSQLTYSGRDRDELSASAAWFSGHTGGDHEIRFGVDYADLAYVRQNNMPGGGRFYDRVGVPYSYIRIPYAQPVESKGRLLTGYIQDTWRPTHDLTVRFGLRRDDVSFTNDAGQEVAALEKLQPRLGASWNVTGDGRLAVRGTWGRFMHPSALGLPRFARTATTPGSYYFSCSQLAAPRRGVSPEQCKDAFSGETRLGSHVIPTWTTDPHGYDPYGWFLSLAFSGEPNRIQPGIEPTYAETRTLGVEMEVARGTSLGLTWVAKETFDIMEDTCGGNWPTPRADAACGYWLVANLPQLTREYEGFLLDLETRFSERVHMLASWVVSESKGNIEYTGSIGSDYDVYPLHYMNRYGFLTDHRKHRVKVHGHVSLPRDVVLGFGATWSSPFVYTPWRWGDPYGIVYEAPRGSREANADHGLDLQASKGLLVGGRYRMRFVAAIYNALDDEQVLSVCTLTTGCGAGLGVGEATRYREPRRFEAGVRFEF